MAEVISERRAQTKRSPFNTPLECGIRALIVLTSQTSRPYDLQRLCYYDYLLVHSGDVEGAPPSIHPPTPLRSGEILVRRRLIEQGLYLLLSRNLITRSFTGSGVGYLTTQVGQKFVTFLTTDYIRELQDRALWLTAHFDEYSDDSLSRYMQRGVAEWGTEFINDPEDEE